MQPQLQPVHKVSIEKCKNCATALPGKYCSQCGEKRYSEHDKSVFHLVEEGLHFITHLDGTLFTTIKTMVKTPGQVSLDYCDGIRKRYFKPLSLFLVLVVLYLLFPIFEGLNMRLAFYLSNPYYGGYAQQQVDQLLQKGMSMDELTRVFHAKSETVSKFLLLIIIPLLALCFWLFTFKRRKYFFDQMVFSAEINSAFLLWGFLVLPAVLLVFLKVVRLFTPQPLAITDELTGLLVSVPMCFYVGFASGRFYQLSLPYSLGLSIVFYVAHNVIVQLVYKFILFVIVIKAVG